MNLEKRELEMQIIEAQGNVLALPYKNTLAVSLFFQKKMKIGPWVNETHVEYQRKSIQTE